MKQINKGREEKTRIIKGLLSRSINPDQFFIDLAIDMLNDSMANRKKLSDMLFSSGLSLKLLHLAEKQPEIAEQWETEFSQFIDGFLAENENPAKWRELRDSFIADFETRTLKTLSDGNDK